MIHLIFSSTDLFSTAGFAAIDCRSHPMAWLEVAEQEVVPHKTV